jgi:hypothetical protein
MLGQNLGGLHASPEAFSVKVEPAPEARSPSGKAKVCKTFIGGSIPPRASNSSNTFSFQRLSLSLRA